MVARAGDGSSCAKYGVRRARRVSCRASTGSRRTLSACGQAPSPVRRSETRARGIKIFGAECRAQVARRIEISGVEGRAHVHEVLRFSESRAARRCTKYRFSLRSQSNSKVADRRAGLGPRCTSSRVLRERCVARGARLGCDRPLLKEMDGCRSSAEWRRCWGWGGVDVGDGAAAMAMVEMGKVGAGARFERDSPAMSR